MAPAALADAEREGRLNDILAAYFDAIETGQPEDRETLLAHHPDLAAELRAFFNEQEQVFGLAGPLRSLLEREQVAKPWPGAETGEEIGGGIATATLPRSFGEYELLEQIGAGGMGVVYRARQSSLNRLVALKVIRAGEWASADEVRRFRNEAELVALLDHPHVVPVYDVGEPTGQVFFSMKLIGGGSLAGQLGRFRDDPKAAAELLATVARAVHHAHQRGVLHRDLKPSNILLDEDSRPYVTDFGLARRVTGDSTVTQSGAIVGTPSYVAPEQTTGQKGTVTTATDVYGLGTVLYALLTGQPPFQAENALETLVQVREREPQPPRLVNRRVNRDLETICLACLAKEPLRRYASALALAEDLDRFLAGKPIQARPVGMWERGVKSVRRRPLAVATALCLLVLLMALMGSLGWVLGDRAARQGDAEGMVREALAAAAPGLREGNPWDPALIAAAQRAMAQLNGDLVGEDFRRRAEQLQKDVQMLAELERIRLDRAGIRDGHFDTTRSDPQYAQAYRQYGIDLEALVPEEAAALVQGSAIQAHLVAGLDDWAHALLAGGRERASQKATQLLAVARHADPDSWRNGLRELVLSRDAKKLEQLALSAPVEELLQPTLGLLGDWVAVEDKPAESMVALLRRAQQRFPADFWINLALATALSKMQPPLLVEAIGFNRAVVALRPQSPGAHYNLGAHLKRTGLIDEAIREYRTAIALDPKFAQAHNNLGSALAEQGKMAEAFAEIQNAIELRPHNAMAHNNLGNVLGARGKLREAEAAYRKAIELDPEDALAHANLSKGLRDRGKLAESVAACWKAIELRPDCAEAYFNLGCAEEARGKRGDALAAFRKAIEIKPNYGDAYNNLGNLLGDENQLVEAEAACRKAIELKPGEAKPYYNLGRALLGRQRLAEAEAAFRKSIEVKDDAVPRYDLAIVLKARGNVDGAIVQYRGAIKLKSDYAEAHCNLASCLIEKGQFAEALTMYRRGHELGSKAPGWRYPSAEWVKAAERLVEFDGKLAAILSGQAQPADTAERLALAKFCQLPGKKLYAAAQHFFSAAFAAEPQVAENLNPEHRYQAACAAALAGCGQGKDAGKLSDMEKLRSRDQALAWLRAELDALERQTHAGHPEMLVWIERVAQAQKHAGFKGVRESLATLPDSEQAAWRKLWADANLLLTQARAGLSQTTEQGTLTDKALQQDHNSEMDASKRYVIDMRSSVFDTYLKLFDGKGKLVAENDDVVPNNLNSRIVFTPTQSGRFRIVATSFEERGRGSYTLTISTLSAPKEK